LRICGVPLPRSDGTCTRCPMEVMLIASDRWSCTVRIRREYDDDKGDKHDQVKEETFGKVLANPEDVELAIRRAQKAVLNPGKPAKDFLTYNFDSKEEAASNELQFSRNLVVLEVRGMPYNLTLIDLPGIINSTENEDDTHLIQLIRKVVKSYISKPHTIIVAAISCKNDIDNQTVFALANEVKEGKQRTLGVLTKVDQIEEGCHDGWLGVMQGEKFPLELGYYMVRNSTKVELDEHIGAEEATWREKTFFEESTALQPLRDNKNLSQRLGVPSLIKMLSDILVQKVKQQLPDMKQSVDEQLKKTRTELAELPPVVQEKERADVLQQALRSLDRDAKLLLNAQGCLSSKHFVQRWHAIYEGMARRVFSTRPRFILLDADASGMVEASYGDSKDFDGDDEEGSFPAKLTLGQVKDIVAKERSYELPKFTPYTALQSVIQHFQGMWNEHAFQCLDKSAELLKTELNIIIVKHFGRFRDSHLESIVRLCMEDVVDQQYSEARKQITLLIEMESTERQPPFTLNRHYFEESHCRILERMKAEMCKYQMRGVDQQVLRQDVANALAALARIPGFQGMTQDQLLALKPCNPDVGEELPIMAATMAYFKVSSKRYVDYVALSITRLLYVRVAESIEGHVDRYLKRLSAEAAAGKRESANPLLLMKDGQADAGASRQWQDSEVVLSLVADDPKIAKQRGSLQAKLESLQATRSVLSRFA